MAPRGAPRAGLLAGGAVLLCLVAAARGAYRGRRQTYWFNEVTKVTQWEEPPKHEFIDGEPPPGRRAAPARRGEEVLPEDRRGRSRRSWRSRAFSSSARKSRAPTEVSVWLPAGPLPLQGWRLWNGTAVSADVYTAV